jgi:hypothetical protein
MEIMCIVYVYSTSIVITERKIIHAGSKVSTAPVQAKHQLYCVAHILSKMEICVTLNMLPKICGQKNTWTQAST